MALLVQKYGGTSVGSVERIMNVARRCLAAMAGETNRLLGLVSQITGRPDEREQDVVVSSGEQVSVGLLALAIQSLGGRARSFLGHQIRILTDSAFSRARIQAIQADKLFEALERGEIAVVAGFQGVDEAGNITTLGRGGSDTSAVALAAAVNASACEIYTDVDGVFTTDPSICPAARKLERISYEEMLELASLGAKVLQIRSVAAAMNHNVPLWVRSSFNDDPGTLVAAEDSAVEQLVVSGIAYDRHQAKIAVRGVPDTPGVAASLFDPLADEGVVVDMIVQNTSVGGHTDVTFTVARTDLDRAREIVERVAAGLGAGSVEADDRMAKVSVVGVGMRTHAGVAARMFHTLAEENINVQMISTSEIKVSAVIDEKYVELAVRSLHTAFGLDAAPAAPAA
jgi:aspartate kinase